MPDRYDRYVYPVAVLIVVIAQNVIESLSGKELMRPSTPPAPTTVDPVAEVP